MNAGYLLATLATGAAAGVTAGLIGVGGGVVTVPFLDMIWSAKGATGHQAFAVARGTSLAIMVFTSASAAWGHYKKGAVKLGWTWRMAIGGLFGAAIGSVAGTLASPSFARAAFGVLALFVAYQFFRGKESSGRGDSEENGQQKLGTAVLLGALVGAFSAFFGVGGGVVAVPILTKVYRFRIHEALGTSSALIVAMGLIGACFYVLLGVHAGESLEHCVGYVDLTALVSIAAASVAFARVGVILAHRLKARVVELVFAAYAVAVAIKMLAPAVLP